jgi:hypothetical protein
VATVVAEMSHSQVKFAAGMRAWRRVAGFNHGLLFESGARGPRFRKQFCGHRRLNRRCTIDAGQCRRSAFPYVKSIVEINPNADRCHMKSFAIHTALLTGLGALMFAGMVASTVPAAAKCMIDEGNGRYTPCEALYRSKKCMIDEGNGRFTPCEALVKQSKSKARKKKG